MRKHIGTKILGVFALILLICLVGIGLVGYCVKEMDGIQASLDSLAGSASNKKQKEAVSKLQDTYNIFEEKYNQSMAQIEAGELIGTAEVDASVEEVTNNVKVSIQTVSVLNVDNMDRG